MNILCYTLIGVLFTSNYSVDSISPKKEKLKCLSIGDNKWDVNSKIDKANITEFVTCQSDDDVCCLRREKFIVKGNIFTKSI